MRHAEIVFELTGQVFHYDPPEMYRASGTPTVEVFSTNEDDDGAPETAITGAASVDAVNTTLSAASSAGESTLTLTLGTGVAKGRRYLLTDVNGECEWVDVAGVNGTAVAVTRPLINSYATASTFQGTRISIAVDSAWVSTKDNLTDVLDFDWHADRINPTGAPSAAGYRLRWAYTVNGIATIGVSYADLVRYQAKNLVTGPDVDRLIPGWLDRLPPDYRSDQGAGLVDEAFMAVKMDALTDAQLLRRIRDTQVLAELVKYRANVLAAQTAVMAGRADPQTLTIARDLYDQRYNSLLREPKVAVDQTGGGSNAEAIRLPVWRR